jgi:hypothetical protein
MSRLSMPLNKRKDMVNSLPRESKAIRLVGCQTDVAGRAERLAMFPSRVARIGKITNP